MNADEVVRALRWLARDADFVFAEEQLNAAADLIESLQAQLAAQKGASYWKSAWETECTENEKLHEALAESQRREQEAIGWAELLYDNVPLTASARDIRDGYCKWRGAEKGEGV